MRSSLCALLKPGWLGPCLAKMLKWWSFSGERGNREIDWTGRERDGGMGEVRGRKEEKRRRRGKGMNGEKEERKNE